MLFESAWNLVCLKECQSFDVKHVKDKKCQKEDFWSHFEHYHYGTSFSCAIAYRLLNQCNTQKK